MCTYNDAKAPLSSIGRGAGSEGKSLRENALCLVRSAAVFAHPDAVLAFAVIVAGDARGTVALLFVEAARGRIFFLHHQQHVAFGQGRFQGLQQALADAMPAGVRIDADVDDAGKPTVLIADGAAK